MYDDRYAAMVRDAARRLRADHPSAGPDSDDALVDEYTDPILEEFGLVAHEAVNREGADAPGVPGFADRAWDFVLLCNEMVAADVRDALADAE